MGKFEKETDAMAYAMGMNIGEYVVNLAADLDHELIAAGLRGYLAGKPELGPEEYRSAMEKLQARMKSAGEKEVAELSELNRTAEAEFMTNNAKVPGVKVTESGLQYLVIREGDGPKPAMNSKVRVHYEGRLLDGTVFDSSVSRGEPLEFMLTQVIAGWTEGLQLMNVGSKYRLYIPARLGYGERGAGQAIPPCAALIFDVELLAIV